MDNKSLVLFDLDGTLVDSRADLATAVNLMRADYGLNALSRETITGYVGNGMATLVRRSLADFSQEYAAGEAVERMNRYYLAHLLDETTPYVGVAEALETLRVAGSVLAVVTNKPEAPAREVIEGLGLSSYFLAIVGGGTCATIKPDPECLFYVMNQAGCSPGETWMVGDNYTDLAAGRNAGVKRCFCRYGFGSPQDEGWDLAVDSLPEFADAVLRRS